VGSKHLTLSNIPFGGEERGILFPEGENKTRMKIGDKRRAFFNVGDNAKEREIGRYRNFEYYTFPVHGPCCGNFLRLSLDDIPIGISPVAF